MHKKWLFSGLVAIFLAANLFYWLPVMADPSVCSEGFKCFFNDEGSLFFKSSSSTSDFLYLNYIGSNAYGLAVSATGELYHDGVSVVVADGGTYGLNISGSSNAIAIKSAQVAPGGAINNSQSSFNSQDQRYLDSTVDLPVYGFYSNYHNYENRVSSQLALVIEGDATGGNQYLQFRFNDPADPNNWGIWHEVCDLSNNCRNLVNYNLDDRASSSLVMYGDPDGLFDSGLKIGSDNLSDCGSLSTTGGVIGCGAAGTGGGVDGSGTANYITKWSNTSTIGSSLIYDNGTNVGVGTTSPQGKLAVAGTGYFTGAVRVGTPITSSDAVDRNYVDSAISALGGGEAVTFAGVSVTTLTGNQGGYDNANSLCAAVDSASHICTTEDILAIINNGNASTIPTTTTGYWISNGPPGYTVNANDCSGYNSNSDNDFGTVWIKVDNSHYFGALQPCGQAVKFACCK